MFSAKRKYHGHGSFSSLVGLLHMVYIPWPAKEIQLIAVGVAKLRTDAQYLTMAVD